MFPFSFFIFYIFDLIFFNGDVYRTCHLKSFNPAPVFISKSNPPMFRTKSPPYIFFFQKSITLGCISQYGRKDLLLLPFHHEFQPRSHLQNKVFFKGNPHHWEFKKVPLCRFCLFLSLSLHLSWPTESCLA